MGEHNGSSRGFFSYGPGYGAPDYICPAGQIYPTAGTAYPPQSYSASAYASTGYSPAGYPGPCPPPHSGCGGVGAIMSGGASVPFGAHHVSHGHYGHGHGHGHGHSHGHYGGKFSHGKHYGGYSHGGKFRNLED